MSPDAERLKVAIQSVLDQRPNEEKLAQFGAIGGEVRVIVGVLAELLNVDRDLLPRPTQQAASKLANDIGACFNFIGTYIPNAALQEQAQQVHARVPRILKDAMDNIWPTLAFELWSNEGLRAWEEEARARQLGLEQNTKNVLEEAQHKV